MGLRVRIYALGLLFLVVGGSDAWAQRRPSEPVLPDPPRGEVIEVPTTPRPSPAALGAAAPGGAGLGGSVPGGSVPGGSVRYDEFGLVPGASDSQLALPDPVLDPDWPLPELEALAAEPEPEPETEPAEPAVVPALPKDWRIEDLPKSPPGKVSETDLALDRRPEFAEDHWAGPEDGEPLEELGSFEPLSDPQMEE